MKQTMAIVAATLLLLLITIPGRLLAYPATYWQQDQNEDEENARGIFQQEEGDGFMLDILLKRPNNDTWLSVPPDTVFHNGDRVKLGLRSNFDGYIYIVNVGTSGTKRIMVPGPVSTNHKLQRGAYQQFLVGELTGQPGEEILYIISSPTKIERLEAAITNNNGVLSEPTTPTKPVAQPAPNPVENKVTKTDSNSVTKSSPSFRNKNRIGVVKSIGSKVIQVLGLVSLFSREVTSEYSTEDNKTYIVNPQGRLKGGEFAAFELVLKHG